MSLLFHEKPFYRPLEGVEQPHNFRLYRPVQDLPGRNDLFNMYEHVVETLQSAGFTDADTTVQLPGRYEVSIVSKGSINRAVTETNSDILQRAKSKTIKSILFDGMPPSAKHELPVILTNIDFYKALIWKESGALYAAGFLAINGERWQKCVGRERSIGYDTLRVLSSNQSFARKLQKKPQGKEANAFRIAAFHNPDHLPNEELFTRMMPRRIIRAVLGPVTSASFE